jgi:hypothetical protein
MLPGSDIAKLLPENPKVTGSPCGLDRDAIVLGLVKDGNYVHGWRPVTVKHNGQRAVFLVSGDALRLGVPGNSFRVALSACGAQNVADAIGACMLTPKLLDEAWKQADVRVLPPVTVGPDVPVPAGIGGLPSLSRMLLHDERVEQRATLLAKEINKPLSSLLLGNVGKHWVNSTKLAAHPRAHGTGRPAAVNYGWYGGPNKAATDVGIGVWQPEQTGHDVTYVDYSQTARFVAREVGLFGAGGVGLPAAQEQHSVVDIFDLAVDPDLWPLVSHDGPVDMRHWAVPKNGTLVATWHPPKLPAAITTAEKTPGPVSRPTVPGGMRPPPGPFTSAAAAWQGGWTLVAGAGFAVGLLGAWRLGKMTP